MTSLLDDYILNNKTKYFCNFGTGTIPCFITGKTLHNRIPVTFKNYALLVEIIPAGKQLKIIPRKETIPAITICIPDNLIPKKEKHYISVNMPNGELIRTEINGNKTEIEEYYFNMGALNIDFHK